MFTVTLRFKVTLLYGAL